MPTLRYLHSAALSAGAVYDVPMLHRQNENVHDTVIQLCIAILLSICRMPELPCVSLLQEEEYLKVATAHYDKLKNWKADNYAYDWDNKSPALHVLFNQIAPSEETKCASRPHLPDTQSSRCM